MLCPGKLSQLMGIRERKVGGGYLRVRSGGFAADTCLYPSCASQRSSMKLTSGKDTRRTCAKCCHEKVAQVRSEQVGKDLFGRMDLLGRLLLALQNNS